MGIERGRVLAARYRAERLLGRGGMGEVWQCMDLAEERAVAVKTVLPEHLADPNVRRLFHAEVVAVARLSHPGIVEIYDLLEEDDGTLLLVMALRPGRSLEQGKPAHPSWSFVRSVLVQLLEALAHAHARSVLHLDLKPANVIIEPDGRGAHRVTLVDFGIARVKSPGRAAESWVSRDAVFGTPGYMAPEQFQGRLTKFGPWTDLYSLGIIAYELCTGALPHEEGDDFIASARKRAVTPPPSLVTNVNVPIGFRDLCARLLALSPSARPACAADVLAEIERLDPRPLSAETSAAVIAVSFDDDVAGLLPPGTAPTSKSAVTLRATGALETARTIETGPESARTIVAETTGPESARTIVAEATGESGAASVRGAPVRITQDEPLAPRSRRMQTDAALIKKAEQAFTTDAMPPSPGAYGLFGLRELGVLGRTDERRRLWDAVAATGIHGRPRVVLLEGPAGTGKSRLARDAAEKALELGICSVLTTHWSASGSPDEGLRGLCENALESRGSSGPAFLSRLEFWLERNRGTWDTFAREMCVLLRPAPDAAPDAELPVRVAVDVVTRLAAQRSVLLWLDDVQWSRGEAVRLAQALADVKDPPPVCVLVTARDDELGDGQEHAALVGALERLCGAGDGASPGIARVAMQPLDEAATKSLIRGLLDLESEVADIIVRRAEGNPLFITQLVGQLVSEGVIERRGARYALSRAVDVESIVPSNIGAVWARRVAVSGASERDLQALAIVRERVAAEVVGELIELAGESFAASLERALSAGLVRKDGELYGFSHGLLRAYLTSSIDDAARRDLSALAAKALATLVDREDVQEERAHHLRRAGALGPARDAMLDASLWSWRRLEHDKRSSRLTALIAWAEEDGERAASARALAELGSMCAEQGRHAEASEAIARATAALESAAGASDAQIAWVKYRQGQVLRLQGKGAEATPITQGALERARAAGAHDVEALILGQLALVAQRAGDAARAAELFDAGAVAARNAGSRATEAQCLAFRAQFLEPARSEAALREASEMARAAGALRVELMARHLWCDALWRVGERLRAREEAARVSSDAARCKVRQIASLAELHCALWAISDEDWRAARDHRALFAARGAATGAQPERAHLAAIDVILALVSHEAPAIESAFERLAQEGKGYSEESFLELLATIRRLAPSPRVLDRLDHLSTA